ncbi:hypothetical protein [Propionivibrio limicola]|uniref:hypothetical protein n=1 Tax=Propionivibrio limicola TaxID=167645 RepID=UPI0012928488|nr:hypothetical protein [Propionivibrio limicola]
MIHSEIVRGEQSADGEIVNERIAVELEQVRLFNDVMRGQLQAVAEATEIAAFRIAERLHVLDREVAKLESITSDTTAPAEGVRQCISRMAGGLFEAHAQIQFQDVVRQQIELIVQALGQLDEHALQLARSLRDPGPSVAQPSVAERLDELYSGYVMDRQRVAHDVALQRETPSTGTAPLRTELF